MTFEQALALVAGQRLGVLVTLRGNGRPQTSNVVYAVRDGQVRVSLTEDRAKTKTCAGTRGRPCTSAPRMDRTGLLSRGPPSCLL